MPDQRPIPVPPVETEHPRVGEPKETAAGIPALVSSLRHVAGEMTVSSCVKTLSTLNQMGGFDCPGCAWPDPDQVRSALGEFCENGVKAVAWEATRKRATPGFFKKHSLYELSRWSDHDLGKAGRITHPMLLHQGASHYEPVSWEAAFRLVADQLRACPSPDDALFYTSGRTSNEAAFLYQLFVRMYGTNNLPDCSNMCHESSGAGLSETLGIGKGSVRLEDFHLADLVLVVGQNPGTNHPRMLTALQAAKRRGAAIISVNPLREAALVRFRHPQELSGILGEGTAIADLFLQVRINGDVALFKSIMRLLLEAEEAQPGSVFDLDFIRGKTAGYEPFVEDLRRQDARELADQAGVPFDQVVQAADMIRQRRNIIICWAMGLTQHKNAVGNIRELVNLLLLKGSIGKPGAGACPVRGHSNVQGDRTMGIWEAPQPAFLDRLAEVFHFEPPRHHGYNTVRAIQAMAEGKIKVFFALGGNFLSATPDTEHTARALQHCELTVHVSTKLNRSHLITGRQALILPCLGRTESDVKAGKPQFQTVENSMGIVHSTEGRLKPASPHLLSEVDIVCRLAEATLPPSDVGWLKLRDDYDQIRELIERTIPGFEDYNRRVRNPAGFYLPNSAREGEFRTATGRANFTLNTPARHELSAGEYLMMTIRSHDQFNTTVYGLDDRYRGIYNGRRVVFMNPGDIAAAGLQAGDWVDLSSTYNGVLRRAPRFLVVAYDIPRQCVATYFPEANPLVPADVYADVSETPLSKSVVVRMERAASF